MHAAHRSLVTFIADVFEGLKLILSWPLIQFDVQLITRLYLIFSELCEVGVAE